MAFDLNNFFNNFSKKTEQSAVGIDIGSSSIKIVEIKKKNDRAVLHTYGEIALGPYAGTEIGRATKLPPDKIAEALRDVLKESKVSTNVSAVSIPMRSSMVSIFNMPIMDDKQLAQMVPIEARKYIPVPIGEVTLDWFVVPDEKDFVTDKREKKFVEVMVVAIHNDVLSDYSSVVTNSNLQTSFFEIEMFSTLRAVIDSTDLEPVMIIDIGASATKIYIAERGVIRDSHTINRGSQEITLNIARTLNINIDFAEKMKRNYGFNEQKQDQVLKEAIDWIFDPIFLEAKESMLSFQKKNQKIVSKAILVGGGALLQGLSEKAKSKIQIETMSGDPFSKVETPAFLVDILKQTGASFTSAIGIALRKLQEMD
ncbi:MAG TPA: type IV pilus assembly protein PilM [Candidatus Paceibacterota bacterium]|nr:type IV pilus assembly protein PilM [Candidatus Paceibacterota bacterium]HMP19173.1 type IV pilus assembly protein PilM [Candidatus Paceibacterota bacterium]HMP85224.1 type IV pilus assembly protein PilM [Candidatus Paceibacterota bacterium]